MKILLVNDYGYQLGGAETHFFDLVELLKEDHQVITVSSNYLHKNKQFVTDYQISASGHFLNLDSVFNVKNYFEFKRILKKEKPDVIHYHNIFYQLSPSVILAGLNYRKIMTLHDYYLICYGDKRKSDGSICEKSLDSCRHCSLVKNGNLFEKIKKCIARFLAKKIDSFIAPSSYLQNQFQLNGFNNINLLPHFIKPVSNIEKYYQEDYEKYFLYIGRLVEQKGLKLLINAFAETNLPNVKLYIAGEGPQKEELVKLTESLNISNRVLFLGRVEGEEKKRLLANCLANVLPSLWPEVAGLSVYEAVAFGRPSIASNVGGIKDFIDNNFNGLLVDNNTEWIVSLNKLAENEHYLANKLGEVAFKSAQILNLEIYLTKLNDIYADNNKV